MTNTLRIILLIAGVLTAIWILLRIRKSKVRVEDAVFWIFMAFVLIIISIFPQIPYFISRKLGIQTPVNCIFLIIIALLMEKIFSLSIIVSQMEEKMQLLAAEIAIRTNIDSKQNEKENGIS